VKRRHFLPSLAAGTMVRPVETTAAAVRLRKPAPYKSIYRFVAPGRDEFAAEAQAARVAGVWDMNVSVSGVTFFAVQIRT